MYFFLKYILTLFYKKLRMKIVVCLLRELGLSDVKSVMCVLENVDRSNAASPKDFTDIGGIRWSTRRLTMKASLASSNHVECKTRNNHFKSHVEVKQKGRNFV